jgi:hypothetical protein
MEASFFIVEPNRPELDQLSRLADDARLRVVVRSVFAPNDAQSAYRQLEERRACQSHRCRNGDHHRHHPQRGDNDRGLSWRGDSVFVIMMTRKMMMRIAISPLRRCRQP